jgi:hypothetical protein
MASWSDLKDMHISVQKTKTMILYPPRLPNPSSLEIKLGCDVLVCVDKFKYLGVWLDQNLSFENLSKLILKHSSIARHQQAYSKKQLKVFCDSLVLSALDYLLPVCGSLCNSQLDKFDKILIKMLKHIIL